MKKLRNDTRTSLALAALAILLLLLASASVLKAIETEYRRNVSEHILSKVDTMARVLELTNADAMARVRTIAEEPRLKAFAKDLIGRPGDAPRSNDFAEWITPIYRSRSFEGYTLIVPDSLIVVASSSPAYIGKAVATRSTLDTLKRAEAEGAAVGRPTPAPRPVVTFGVTQPSGMPFQLVCARIDEGERLLGFLCLRDNPAQRLYLLLEAARTGGSGESYVIDAEARILSPVRFENQLAAPGGEKPGWSMLKLFARTPSINPRGRPAAAQSPDAPPTAVAKTILEQGSASGLVEGYPDYRGRNVIGAGRWFPEMQMGIIVEEDMDEAFRSFYSARLVLGGLAGIAIALVIGLTSVQLRSRRALVRSERQLAAFRDHIPAGMTMKDREGRYIMANPVAESAFHFAPGGVIGKLDSEFMSVEQALIRKAEHEQVLQTVQPMQAVHTIARRDGTTVVYRVVRFPILNEENSAVVAVGAVGFDITEQVKVQHELEELTQNLERKVTERTAELVVARDQAEAASRAKAEFLANMSHEIRTPLNAVIGMSHLAANVNTAPRVAHYLQRIQSSGQHLLSIVSDILDLSKIEAGKLAIDSVEFSLESLLENVAGLVWERADAKGLELIIAIDPGLPDHLLGDSMRLGQILINFANNAVKFTEIGEIVLRVRLLRVEGRKIRLRFEVEDSGIGIAEEKLVLLFTPFQQLDGSLNRRFEGTGLGLAISKNLAELMDGEVAVTSTPGQGSLFSLEIELGIADAPDSPIVPAIDLRERRVLAVDDNAHARGQLAAMLRTLSFRVDEAGSGQDAIDRVAEADARDNPYEVVFMDWKMPGLDGHETAGQIRLLSLRRPHPRMVLIAPGGTAGSELLDHAAFDCLLNKPVTPSHVFDTVMDLFASIPPRSQDVPRSDAGWKSLRGCRALLVEDNPINQEVVHDLLEMVGMRVVIASNGVEALQTLNNEPFDVILMDVHMPIMNGFETTEAIRKEPRFAATPIVALTANALDGDQGRCRSAGMDDYVAKPIDPKRLFGTLVKHCGLQARAETPDGERADDRQIAAETDSVQAQRIFEALSGIPGLDTAHGLERMMGRVDLYAKLAQRIGEERSDLPQRLQNALNANDPGKIGDLIHGTKSILGALGALQLHEACVELEKRLATGLPMESAIAEFNTAFSLLMACLREATR